MSTGLGVFSVGVVLSCLFIVVIVYFRIERGKIKGDAKCLQQIPLYLNDTLKLIRCLRLCGMHMQNTDSIEMGTDFSKQNTGSKKQNIILYREKQQLLHISLKAPIQERNKSPILSKMDSNDDSDQNTEDSIHKNKDQMTTITLKPENIFC